MNTIELIIIGIVLAADASTVAMSNGMIDFNMKFKRILLIALTFGVMQGLMPIIGYYSGKIFADLIQHISHYIAFILLVIIGTIMIYESTRKEDFENKLTKSKVFVQAIATSIDALIIGVAFALLDVDIYLAALIITLITTALCIAAICVGCRFGLLLKNKAQVIGGIILILWGFKILFEVLFT